MFWNLPDRQIKVDQSPFFFGILNITPDSFSDAGLYLNSQSAIRQAESLIEQGAYGIDLGAESTRPGAKEISIQEEWERLEPVLKNITKNFNTIISIDTRKSEIARRALDLGAHVINDVSGARYDPEILEVVSEYKAGYVAMHSRSDPEHMLEHVQYVDFFSELKQELVALYQDVLEAGISPESVVLDPGFGFAKNSEQNQLLLDRLSNVLADVSTDGLNQSRPWYIGLSKKRFLKEKAGGSEEKLIDLSAQACFQAFQQGARFFRVHAVRETIRCFR